MTFFCCASSTVQPYCQLLGKRKGHILGRAVLGVLAYGTGVGGCFGNFGWVGVQAGPPPPSRVAALGADGFTEVWMWCTSGMLLLCSHCVFTHCENRCLDQGRIAGSFEHRAEFATHRPILRSLRLQRATYVDDFSTLAKIPTSKVDDRKPSWNHADALSTMELWKSRDILYSSVRWVLLFNGSSKG